MKNFASLLSVAFLAMELVFASTPATASDTTDRQVQPGVPAGQLISGTFGESRLFPGTTRSYQIYVPKQYDGRQPANLMVFMDGSKYARAKGPFRVPVVFDNLINQGAMPITIAVFVDPGTIPAERDATSSRRNRSFEYDSVDDRYASFLIDEFLPTVLADYKVSNDPEDRAVAGSSSGGICAFTVAWHRPDQFGKVLSHIGSFVNIRGGWGYPGLVRKTKDQPKPIKVYLQDGVDDLSNLHGSWPLANRDLAAALQYAGYQYKLVMTEGGHGGKWAGEVFPSALRWLWDDESKSMVVPSPATKPKWEPHPDAIVNEDVPQGRIEVMPPLKSTVFPGTVRDWAIYVPAQYDPSKSASLMVFQDGERLRKANGRWRIPTVFDNLIARGDMPPTIAVFLNPGQDPSKPTRPKKFNNRGFEYDSLGARYSQFLLEDVLPIVESKYNVSNDPEQRAIGGSSSGAICAFTVAWNRPDQFGKVYSNVGSFTNLRGGNVYPAWVRKTEPKPIRVYMSDTSGDVDNAFGSWPWANQRMAAALQYMGYDLRFDWEEGYGHNADFGSSRFPEAMKWLWRDGRHEPKVDTSDDLGSDFTLLELLIPGEDWQVVAENLGFADGLCTAADGSFYFCDMRAPAIYRIDPKDDSRSIVAKVSVSGLMLGPDGKLYGCQGKESRVISIDPSDGEVQVVATGVKPNDLAVASDGTIYITETRAKQVTRIDPATGTVTVVDEGITRPNGIALTADGGTLAVSDHGGGNAWTFRVLPDGRLDSKMPTMTLRLPIDPEGDFAFHQPPPYKSSSRGDGMAVGAGGRYYITSALGVQVFDPTERFSGLLPTPDTTQPLTSCVLGKVSDTEPEKQYLYIANGKTVFRRQVKVIRD